MLRNIYDHYGNAWSKFGFVDAFHPGAKWYSRFVLGIDVGITLLMTENSRTGSVWDLVMSTPEATRGMEGEQGFSDQRRKEEPLALQIRSRDSPPLTLVMWKRFPAREHHAGN